MARDAQRCQAPASQPGPLWLRGMAYRRRGATRGTATSSFGVGRREGHDASVFYERFPALTVSGDSVIEAPAQLDKLWVADARSINSDRVADNSVALVVTSPPYFAGKEYEAEAGGGHVPASYDKYLQMLRDVLAECVRKLEPGGRIAVNVANLGRKPYRSLSGDVIGIIQDQLGLLLRGEVIWQKALGAGGNCAWGSFQRPTNPVLRDLTERIVIASKGRFDRALSAEERAKEGKPSKGTINADEFMEATTDLWYIPAESATRVGHPAPFPVELPERLIDLYTYRGDLVLDPFMGSGTTAVAAVRTGRHYVGFDTDASYIKLAEERILAEHQRMSAGTGTQRWEDNGSPAPAHDGQGCKPSPGQMLSSPAPAHDRQGSKPSPGQMLSSPAPAHDRQGSKPSPGQMLSSPAPPHDGQGTMLAKSQQAGESQGDVPLELFSLSSPVNGVGAVISGNFQARSVREGRKAQEKARALLDDCGFGQIREKVKFDCGVEVNFSALDKQGNMWLFDVSGAFSITQRPGLRRTDTLWKAIGKAAVLHSCPDSYPLVLLTSNRPVPNSAGNRALNNVVGPDKAIRAIIEMGNPADEDRLQDLAHG